MKREIYSIFIDGKEYSKTYRRYKKHLCEMFVNSIKYNPAYAKATITIEPI